mmetsp:Transcript_25840/g.51831  ORF Transcript_25840/g.51831 Transcript_25840/m.51831 type:complete len:151 (+) Transcript_25840:184-636(+)
MLNPQADTPSVTVPSRPTPPATICTTNHVTATPANSLPGWCVKGAGGGEVRYPILFVRRHDVYGVEEGPSFNATALEVVTDGITLVDVLRRQPHASQPRRRAAIVKTWIDSNSSEPVQALPVCFYNSHSPFEELLEPLELCDADSTEQVA